VAAAAASATPVDHAYDIEGNRLRVGSEVVHLTTRRHARVTGLISSADLHRDYDPPIMYPVLSSVDCNDPELLDHVPVRPTRLLRSHY